MKPWVLGIGLLFVVGLFSLVYSQPFVVNAQVDQAASDLLKQNIAITTDSPQASAEAILKLPDVYILPNSFLYWFKQTWEDLQLALASDPEERSQLLLEFSQRRLAEGYQAMEKQDWSAAAAALERYSQQQADLSSSLEKLGQQKTSIDQLLDQLQQQITAQGALRSYVINKAPAEQQSTLASLLQVQSYQQLALNLANDSALLGAQNAQATSSATPSAQPSPTPQGAP